MTSILKIETDKAPKAVGPYSQAVIANDFLFCSGQIAINPIDNQLIQGGIIEQTHQVLNNIEGLLEAASIGFEKVVKMEVFLKDMNDWTTMNEIYGTKFTNGLAPTRTTVEVPRLPKDVLIEITCTAYLK
jgi:2-iminobutanoate/2-iminopropanoate deaminase